MCAGEVVCGLRDTHVHIICTVCDVTHVRECTRPSPAFPYYKQREAGRGPGNVANRKRYQLTQITRKSLFNARKAMNSVPEGPWIAYQIINVFVFTTKIFSNESTCQHVLLSTGVKWVCLKRIADINNMILNSGFSVGFCINEERRISVTNFTSENDLPTLPPWWRRLEHSVDVIKLFSELKIDNK